jgi:hypothetical protein
LIDCLRRPATAGQKAEATRGRLFADQVATLEEGDRSERGCGADRDHHGGGRGAERMRGNESDVCERRQVDEPLRRAQQRAD